MKNFFFRRKGVGNKACKAIAEKSRHEWQIIRNDRRPDDMGDCNFLFRWGCTSSVLPNVTIHGTTVNTMSSIHKVNNKSEFRKLLHNEIPSIIPLTWWYEDCEHTDPIFPCIFRPKTHSQGNDLYFCENMADVFTLIGQFGDDFYISEYIPKIAEYRVMMVQGRIVSIVQKVPVNIGDIAWNVHQGATFHNVRWSDWDMDVCYASSLAFSYSGLDFGGVDVIVNEKGNPYVLEVNSAPSLLNDYKPTCFAKAFDYIIDNEDKSFIPKVDDEKETWKHYIHPAISERALVTNE